MNEPLMQLKNVSKSFESVSVLKNVNLYLEKGKILGLVGENGAGKSTMMNVLGGVYQRTSGEVFLEGKLYEPRNPMDATRAGIAFIHQELNLFTNLTVAENIFIDEIDNRTGYVSFRKIRDKAAAILERLGVDIRPDIPVESLPMGMRQMVEIAKALRKNAKIVFFDEPTTSLSTVEKENLFRIIRDLSSQGIAMIYISHTLDDIMMLCDEILVLRDGEIIGEQNTKSNMTKNKMIKMMAGREMSQLYPYIEKTVGSEMLNVEHLNQGNTLRDISFSLRSGEILGLFGLMGAGRSELARAIYGLDPVDSGIIVFSGEQVSDLNPRSWIKKGMAFITENRRDEGLLLAKCVKENIVLCNLPNMQLKFGYHDTKKEECDSDDMICKLRIKTHDKSKQILRLLSGGNQQKVVIGKWLLTNPKVFILDEPTRGIDVGAKFEIYNQINTLAEEGTAVLFISSEMEELMGVCDRILVFSKGEITGEVMRKEFNRQHLLKLAIGEVDQ